MNNNDLFDEVFDKIYDPMNEVLKVNVEDGTPATFDATLATMIYSYCETTGCRPEAFALHLTEIFVSEEYLLKLILKTYEEEHNCNKDSEDGVVDIPVDF